MTTLERAARAAFDAMQADGAGFGEPWDHALMARVRESYMVATRAVLTAIREPSEGMVRAGGKNMDHEGATLPDELRDRALECWKAMIDAALDEG